MKYVFEFKTAPDSEICRLGGKGASLVRMTRMKLPVPDGFVIAADAFVRTDSHIITVAKEAEDEIDRAIEALSDKYTYAVRSSALNEDGADNSFAGQYETVTDVSKKDIKEAIQTVTGSAGNKRVTEYMNSTGVERSGIAVVVQQFVKPAYAGVLFSADVITGSSLEMVGNYVEGEGEALVSGQKNAEEFRINAVRYKYTGSVAIKKYSRKLLKYANTIRDKYRCEIDIEWAISEGKLYILQARPITTLKRLDQKRYLINGSNSGEFCLTKTNVGEIFMKPLTPMTFSVLEEINNVLGLPCWLDAIDGQAYMNLSVLCSMLVSCGMKEEKAFDAIKDLAGNLPEGASVPVFPFDGKAFRRNLFKILTGGYAKGYKSKLSKEEKREMVQNLDGISRGLMSEIRTLKTNEEIKRYGQDVLIPKLIDGLSSVMSSSGMQMVPLFTTRKKLTAIAGEGTAEELLGGCLGILESMKPLLMLEDVIEGKVSRETFMDTCGQRCVNEMELGEKRPYEKEGYFVEAIEEYKAQGVNVHELKRKSEEEFKGALERFKCSYPARAKRVEKMIERFAKANTYREEIRAKGVWVMCVLREWLLAIGKVNDIGEDVFMLYIRETIALIGGDRSVLSNIPIRKENYARYLDEPQLPGIIIGRFNVKEWLNDPNRRSDHYCEGLEEAVAGSDVKGFPGAAGKVTAKVRVIDSIKGIDELQKGEILVTKATNIGWTRVFPKVAAIVTDIGAPLSHAAIVAREFGIPAVVGCGNATTVLKTGDVVEVNGQAGTVRRIDDPMKV